MEAGVGCVARSDCKREIVTNRLAAGGPDGIGVSRLAHRSEQLTKALTDTRWFGCRSPHDAIDAKNPGPRQICDALDGDACRNFNESVPVPEHLEESDLPRSQPLVSAPGACSAADEPNGSGVPRRATGHRDCLAARHLRGESERERCTPAGRAGARRVDHFVDEAVERWGSHAESSRCPAPVEPPPDTTKLFGMRQPRQRLRNGLGRAVKVLGTPEAIARGEDPLADLGRNAHIAHDGNGNSNVGNSLREVDRTGCVVCQRFVSTLSANDPESGRTANYRSSRRPPGKDL